MLTIGIDASNLREGGGITHLVELLTAANPKEHGISRIVVWGCRDTLAHLPERDWLRRCMPVELEAGAVTRFRWQHRELAAAARREECDLIFSPGGSYTTDFHPFVTMSRNMLPFNQQEVARYGWSIKRLRLELLRRTQARSFKQADGLIFLTRYAQDSVIPIVGDVAGMVATIPHGVAHDFAVSQRAFRDIADCSPSTPFRIVYVSHASPYKHQWHVIAAVSEVRHKTGWPMRLDMIGPRSVPGSVRRIEEAIATYDPTGQWATFFGPLPRAQVREYLAAADLGVFASSCENMPNILLEKMAAGLPIISSDRGPMPEVLAGAGLLFNPERPDSIASALESEIANTDQRRRHSELSLLRAADFQWQRCANDTLAFLRRVAVSTGTRHRSEKGNQ